MNLTRFYIKATDFFEEKMKNILPYDHDLQRFELGNVPVYPIIFLPHVSIANVRHAIVQHLQRDEELYTNYTVNVL